MDHYIGNGPSPYFFSLSREIQVEQNTKRLLKAAFKFCPHNSTIVAGGV